MARDYGITNAAPWASAPAVGATGATYWNTASKLLYVSDGAAWNVIGGGSSKWTEAGTTLSPTTGTIDRLKLGPATAKARLASWADAAELNFNTAGGITQDDATRPSWTLDIGAGIGDAFEVYRLAPGGGAWTRLLTLTSAGLWLGAGVPIDLTPDVTAGLGLTIGAGARKMRFFEWDTGALWIGTNTTPTGTANAVAANPTWWLGLGESFGFQLEYDAPGAPTSVVYLNLDINNTLRLGSHFTIGPALSTWIEVNKLWGTQVNPAKSSWAINMNADVDSFGISRRAPGGASGGAGLLALDAGGNLTLAGTMHGAYLLDSSVTQAKLAGRASVLHSVSVVVPNMSFNTGSTWQTICTTPSLQCPDNNPVLISCNVLVTHISSGTGGHSCYMRLLRDGVTAVGGQLHFPFANYAGFMQVPVPSTLSFIDWSPGAGNHTYTFQWYLTAGTLQTGGANNAGIVTAMSLS